MPAEDPHVALVAHWDWVLANFRLPLARSLLDAGYRVTAICPSGPFTSRLTDAGCAHLDWRVDRRSLNPAREAPAIARLTRLYRAADYDLVHHFTVKPNLYGSLAARRAGILRVVNTFTGLGWLFARERRARVLRLALTPLLRTALDREASRVVVLTEADRDRLVGDRLVHADRVRLVHGDGVDLTAFRPPVAARDASGPPTVLFAGRLLWDKGLRELVDAAQRLRAERVPVRIQLAGSADLGNPASVPEATLAAWQRDGAVELVGHVDDMPELLRGADVAVLPSHHEGVPRFLAEAAACGLPLVATDLPGCRTIVDHDDNGLLVPVGDADALASALRALATDPARRARLGARAAERARTELDEGAVIARYHAVYAELGLPHPVR